MVAWSVEALARAEMVGAIVVALPEGVDAAALEQDVVAVRGGETRAESVRNALERVETEIVVIHDAARPLVTPSLIDSVVDKLDGDPDADGVIAAAPLTDTVKRVAGERITGTEDRETLWRAQTPQAFRTARLREAYGPEAEVGGATDEAMLIERAGGTVLVEAAAGWNLKVTSPEDLEVAELLLRGRSA